MALSRTRSPTLQRENLLAKPGQKPARPQIPATEADLVELRTLLWKIADLHYGPMMGHVVTNRLSAEVDHLIAIHIQGYEFDDKGVFKWKTGIGTSTMDAVRPWSTSTDDALFLAHRFCPHLRLNLRFGGSRHGQVLKARFSRSHPDLSLADKAIPLPAQWPVNATRYPAIAILLTALAALAMEKAATNAASATPSAEIPSEALVT